MYRIPPGPSHESTDYHRAAVRRRGRATAISVGLPAVVALVGGFLTHPTLTAVALTTFCTGVVFGRRL